MEEKRTGFRLRLNLFDALVLIAALYVARKVVRKGLSIALTIVAVLAGLYFLVPNIFYTIIGWLTTLF